MARRTYTLLLWLALPVLIIRLWWRGRREPGYRKAVFERFGFFSESDRVVPRTPLIWIHAVSLGETRAAVPLVRELSRRLPESRLLVTHMTATGRESARALFQGRALFAWLPYDYPVAARAFLRAFRPSVGILMETELWPNLTHVATQRGTPLILANARMSERSARGYLRYAALFRPVFQVLKAVAAQTEVDAQRIRDLGAPVVEVTGNLKFDVQPDPELVRGLGVSFRAGYGKRRVFLAASTREGEEQLLIEAWKRRSRDALLVIVPRHPPRFDEVRDLIDRSGLQLWRRRDGLEVPTRCDVVLGDSLGEMPAYYASADVAFIGGSLLPFGGQNLIEACAVGVPVLVGPHTFNFADAAEAAVREGAAKRVLRAEDAVDCAARLFDAPSEREAMIEAGKRFCAHHQGAAGKIAAMVERTLANCPPVTH